MTAEVEKEAVLDLPEVNLPVLPEEEILEAEIQNQEAEANKFNECGSLIL